MNLHLREPLGRVGGNRWGMGGGGGGSTPKRYVFACLFVCFFYELSGSLTFPPALPKFSEKLGIQTSFDGKAAGTLSIFCSVIRR